MKFLSFMQLMWSIPLMWNFPNVLSFDITKHLTRTIGSLPTLNDKIYCWKNETYVVISENTCGSYKSGTGKSAVGLSKRLDEHEFVKALEPEKYFGTCSKPMTKFRYVDVTGRCVMAIELEGLGNNTSNELFSEVSNLLSKNKGQSVSIFKEGDDQLAYMYAHGGLPTIKDMVYCWESGTYISVSGGIVALSKLE